MGKFFIHLSAFSHRDQNPFWDILFKSHAHLEQSDQLHKTFFNEQNHSPLVLCEHHHQKDAFMESYLKNNPESKTLPEVKTLSELCQPPSPDDGQAKQLLLLSKCIREENLDTDLTEYLNKDGVLVALYQFFTQAQAQDLNPDEYIKVSLLPFKKTLMTLYKKWQKAKTKAPFQDHFLRFQKEKEMGFPYLSEKVKERFIFIYGFTNIAPMLHPAIECLIKQSAQCAWLLNYDDGQDIYAAGQGLFSQLSRYPHSLVAAKTMTAGPLSDLSQRPQINLAAYDSIEAEVMGVCKQILSFLTQHPDCSLDEIGIIYPKASSYLDPLLTTLSDYNIPVKNAAPAPYATDPLSTWFLNALNLLIRPKTDTDFSDLFEAPFLSHLQAEEERAFLINSGRDKSTSLFKLGGQLLTQVQNSPLLKLGEVDHNMAVFWGLKTQFRDFEELAEALYPKANRNGILKAFKTYLSHQKFPQKQGQGLQLIEKSKGLNCRKKVYFILGLVGSFWPGKPHDNLFITPQALSKLNWEDSQDHSRLDRYLFFNYAYHTEQELFLSYPQKSDTKTLMPSHHITQLKDLWGSPILEQDPAMNFVSARERQQSPNPLDSPEKNNKNSPQSKIDPALLSKDKKTPFSITELEAYQNCPRQYFYTHILKERVPEQNIEVSPRDWGQLIHEILYVFYETMIEKGYSFENPAQHDQINTLLIKIAKTKFEAADDGSYYWQIKALILFGSDSEKGLLKSFIQEEIDNPLPLSPDQFEAPFEISLENADDKINLKGKIDMVLANKASGFTAILDYKTGKSMASGSDIKQLRYLQIIAYHLAANHLFQDLKSGGGVLFQIHHREGISKRIVAVTPESKKELFELDKKRPFEINPDFIEHYITHLLALRDAILSGEFTPDLNPPVSHMANKRPQLCAHCDYQLICDYPKRFEVKA